MENLQILHSNKELFDRFVPQRWLLSPVFRCDLARLIGCACWEHTLKQCIPGLVRDTITNVASEPTGQTFESTASDQVFQGTECHKSPQKGKGGNLATGETPLPATVSRIREDVPTVEQYPRAAMGTVVSSISQRRKAEERKVGREGKGQEGQRRLGGQALRFFAYGLFLITAFKWYFGGGGLHEEFPRVCQGEPHRHTGNFATMFAKYSTRGKRHDSGTSEAAESTPECLDEDGEKEGCFREGSREMELMGEFHEARNPAAERKARRDSAETSTGTRGVGTGGKEAEGERRGSGDGRAGDCQRRSIFNTGTLLGDSFRWSPTHQAECGDCRDPAEVGSRIRAKIHAGTSPNAADLRGAPCTEQVYRGHQPGGAGHGIKATRRSSTGCNSSIWSSKDIQDVASVITIWHEEDGDPGEPEASAGKWREWIDSCGSRADDCKSGGVVMHSLRWNGPGLPNEAARGVFQWLFGDRVSGCLTMIVVDFVIFMTMVGYMVWTHKDRERCVVRIEGHSYYKRRKLTNKRHSVGNLLMTYLLVSQNLISGVGSEIIRSDANYESHGYGEPYRDTNDVSSLMARTGPRNVVQVMPSPNMQGLPAHREGGGSSGSEDRPNEGEFHQMAFLFLQDGTVVTGRINWSGYWTMHREIASLIGCHHNHLVGVFHVESPPVDLEEMDTQVILPLRTEEVQHSASVVYVLVDIEYHEEGRIDMVPTRRFATNFPSEATRSQVLRKLEVEDYCGSLKNRCVLWINHENWPAQEVRSRFFRSGDYVQCALPPPESANCKTSRQRAETLMRSLRSEEEMEQDDTVLMQRSASSQSSSRHGSIRMASLHAFGTDYIDLEVEDNGQSLVEQLALTWAFSLDEIMNLHEVVEPPLYEQRAGEATFLLELREDAVHRLWPDDKFILTEFVVRKAMTSERKGQKVVLWARELLTRHQAMTLMRAEEFCMRRETRECVLSHNNRLWNRDDSTSRHIIDGDYLLVEAFVSDVSLNEAWLCLQRLERHECSRRLYTSSSCDLQEEVDSDAGLEAQQVAGRSRSRSRELGSRSDPSGEGAPGNAEEAPRDPRSHLGEDPGHADLSLLQLKTFRTRYFDKKMEDSFSRLPPPGNPSNEVSSAPLSSQPEWISVADGDEEDSHKLKISCFSISDDEVEEEAPREDGFHQSLTLREDRFGFVKLLQRWTDEPLRLDLPEDLDLIPIAWQFLMRSNAGWNGRIQQLHIYTDGSYNPHHDIASFSVAIFGWAEDDPGDRSSFVGWVADVLTMDRDDPQYTGAQAHSAMEAETAGLIWGHIWLLQSGCMLPTTFHYDSLTSGHGAAGTFQIGKTNKQLHKLRQLVHLTQTMRTGMETNYAHVKAHSGCPGNECVDGFAKWAIKGGKRRHLLPSWSPLFCEDDETLKWAWWHYKSIACHPQVPAQNMDHCRWKVQGIKHGMNGIHPIEQKPLSRNIQVELSLTMATYNAMTLRDRQTETGQSGEDYKGALLRCQFQERKLHVVGLQETRASSSGLLITSNYIRCIGSGSGGHHGCELWLSTTWPIGEGPDGPIYFDAQSLTVIHDTPRLMVVQTRPSGIPFIFIVAHAPHDGSEEESKDEWWKSLHAWVKKFGGTGHLICLGDFNARLGRSIPGCVGEILCNQTSDNGDRLIEIMEDECLWSPATFAEVQSGPSWTWTHPKGTTRARLDYILLNQSASLWAIDSWVDTTLQTSLTVRDHELTVLRVGAVWEKATKKHQRRQYDWDSMNTEWGRSTLTSIIETLPEPSWETDVHEHWQCLEDAIHEGLAKNFPKPKPQRRIDLFSDETKEALHVRKVAKNMLEAYDDFTNENLIYTALRSWRDGLALDETGRLTKWHCMTMEIFRLFGLQKFRDSSKKIRILVKKDKADFIDRVTSKANNMTGGDIYKALRPLRIGGMNRKRGITPLPGFGDHAEGITNEKHTDDLWLRHCARMEAGVFTTSSRLLERAKRNSQRRAQEIGAWDLQELPSLGHLEEAFRRVKKMKAGGNDDLRSDLCSLMAAPLAQKFYPLLVKVFTRASEPYQMKGGTLIYAHKSGDRSQPENFRGLLLSSHIGKSIRRTFRQQLVPHYQAWASDTHFSIKVGGNVSQASHALRLFVTGSSRAGQSVGVLFLDIRSAYYRVVRQLMTGRPTQAESIARMMQYFDLGDTDPQSLFRTIAERTQDQEQALDRQREILLEEMMDSTWFTSRHRTTLVESLAGTRPGDGLADLVFGLVFHRITKRIHARLAEELNVQPHAVQGQFDIFGEEAGPANIHSMPELIDVVWADDLAMAWRSPTAAELEDGMKKITRAVFAECLDHALIPNLKTGKTEILMVVKGAGCRAVKADLFNKIEPYLCVPDVPEDLQRVRMIATYRHLGTRISIGLHHKPELKARCGQAGAIYRKFRKQLFQNKLLSLQKRIYLFKSLVMSVLEYNCGTWGRLQSGEIKYLEMRLHGFYRGLARATIPETTLRLWNNTRVRAFVQMPDAQTLLHGARLRYAISIYKSGPPTLWDLIRADGNWICMLQEAQEWFKQQLVGHGPDRHGHAWDPNLHEWCLSSPESLRSWIRKSEQHDILQTVKHSEWREWHYTMFHRLIEGGYERSFPWSVDTLDDPGQLEACLMCHKIFTSRAAWAVHIFRVHGIRNRTRRFIGGSRCDACNREYNNPTSLQNHLNHSSNCYNKLVMAGMDYQELLPGKNNTQEIPRNKYGVPPLRSEGPQNRNIQEAEGEPPDELDWSLMERLVEALLGLPQNASIHQGAEIIKGTLKQSFNSLRDIRKVLRYCLEEFEQSATSNPGWIVNHDVVVEAFRYSLHRCSIEWFFEADEITKTPNDEDIRNAALNFCRQQTLIDDWSFPHYVPRFGAKELIFVHLFSGERRESDIQMWLERSPAPPGAIYHLLSVDVIYDNVAGDLSRPETQERWLSYARRGCIAGAFAGPPCETWSRARALGGVPGSSYGDGGPRLLRSKEAPEGLSSLRIPELKQIILASRLLMFTVALCLEMLLARRFMLVEHPACPEGENTEWLPSIWKLYLVRALIGCKHAQHFNIYQGYFQGISPKPTGLLVICGTAINAQEEIQKFQTRDSLPQSLDMGYDKDRREFKTAALKSYPADLCRGIAHLASTWAHLHVQSFTDLTAVPMQEFMRYTLELQRSFNTVVTRGTDHHRSDAFFN